MTTETQSHHDAASPKAPVTAVSPDVDIFENEEGYLVRADLPGVAQDAVELEFEKGTLTLQAQRPAATEGEDQSGLVYRRAFTVPRAVDASSIQADLSNGVLELRLPKSADLRPRKIAVNS